MTSFELHVPHRSRSDPLTTVGELARRLDPQDAKVTRRLRCSPTRPAWRVSGSYSTALGQLGADGRRQLLDAARHLAVLETAITIAQRELHEALARDAKSQPYCD